MEIIDINSRVKNKEFKETKNLKATNFLTKVLDENISIKEFNEAFDGILEGLKPSMPDATEKEIGIKAINCWASVHGLVGLLRNGDSHDSKSKDLQWIKDNLEEYLEMTTFQ